MERVGRHSCEILRREFLFLLVAEVEDVTWVERDATVNQIKTHH